MTLRIGHFLNHCSTGGTVDMIVSLISNSRHDHFYMTYKASEERKLEFKEKDIELIEILEDAIAGAAAYMNQEADIVHCSSSGGQSAGVEIGIQSGNVVVETCQSPDLPSGAIYSSVSVIPVSKGITHYWQEKDYIDYSRIIYSCSEPITKYPKQEAANAFGLDPDKPIVGRLGRLEGIKRSADFVAAAHELKAINPDVQFLLAGDGSNMPYIEHDVDGFNALHGECMKLPGFLSGNQKNLAYSAMDVFLYPTSMEGFGIVFAEAMSAGIPIVTYSDPVNIDIVGSAGVFVSDNLFTDVHAKYKSLANVTADLLINSREHARLSERSKVRYDAMFRPEIMAEHYDNLYEEIYED